ncbi:MAG: hypothetical protein ACTTGJ_02465, partial [Clostridium sp.]
MQKKNKKMFFEKTIATTMIFVMGAGNFLSVGHSAYVYAASVNELKQLKIEGKTNVRDVDVLVRVSDGRTKGSAINLDVNSKEAYLDVTLNLATSGYINGGVLEISTDKAINFELKKLESKNDKNNNSQNIVEKVEGNKIYLNQIKKDNINENN